MKKKYIKRRHHVLFRILRPVGVILAKLYHCTYDIFPIKKGQNYLILSNHQATLDPVYLCMSFKTPVYLVANDSLFNTSLKSRLLQYCFAPIKKRKATVDIGCIKHCMKIAKEGGNVAMFPEGNRAWAEFQFPIEVGICKLIRLMKLPVLLYNFTGGYGVDPRWGGAKRKGEFRGGVKEILSVEEIAGMEDDTLYARVLSGLRVMDSESGKRYQSERRAEYLERELFICPKCKSISTLHSEGNKVICSACGLAVEYTENLHLQSEDAGFSFQQLVDWYQFQLAEIRKMQIKEDEVIYRDEQVRLLDKTTAKQFVIATGELTLTKDTISVGSTTIPLTEITSATIVGGTKLIINTEWNSYMIKGYNRFNALKYILTFHVLNTGIREEKYYSLNI